MTRGRAAAWAWFRSIGDPETTVLASNVAVGAPAVDPALDQQEVALRNDTKVMPRGQQVKMMGTENDIRAVCEELRDMLLEKNARYGDSALNPVRVMSRASAVEQILVRIDDKLSRLARGSGQETEDVELDLLGYFLLLRVARRRAAGAAVVSRQNAADARVVYVICRGVVTKTSRSSVLSNIPVYDTEEAAQAALNATRAKDGREAAPPDGLLCAMPCEYIWAGGSCSGSCILEPGHTGIHQCKRGTQQGHVHPEVLADYQARRGGPSPAATCGNPCSGFDGSVRCSFVCLQPRKHEGMCWCHAHKTLPPVVR